MLEMPESYLRWRIIPARNNRIDRLKRSISGKNDLNEIEMINAAKREHDLLTQTTPNLENATTIQQKMILDTYYWKKFHCGVTLLMYGDITVVESLFVDRAYLLRECSVNNPPPRFVRFLNLAFLDTLLNLLMLMNNQTETYSIESDYILVDWFRKNKQELVWDNELRKFLIAQFEEKLNSSERHHEE